MDSTIVRSGGTVHPSPTAAREQPAIYEYGLETLDVSIVVPVCDEADSLELLYRGICEAMSHLEYAFEIVFVNDGSKDGSDYVLDDISARDRRVAVVHLRRNYGQTAAMRAGFAMASGNLIVTMDADLQNDPHDIGVVLEKLNEGYDLVHGWRQHRHDALLTRQLPSRCANWLIAMATGFPVRDLGCTMKAMRREVAQELNLYGEMHRFIPVLANWKGARCLEVHVRHHPRRFGQTKYGLSRTLRVILDLMTVMFLIRYSKSPMRLFGTIGLVCWLLAALAGAGAMMRQFLGSGTSAMLLTTSLLSGLMGIQLFGMGLLGEMNARSRFESQRQRPYEIGRISKRNRRRPAKMDPKPVA